MFTNESNAKEKNQHSINSLIAESNRYLISKIFDPTNTCSDSICRFEIWSHISLKLEKFQNRRYTTTVSMQFFISSTSENGCMHLANKCVTSYDALVASLFFLVNRNMDCF